MFDEKSHHFVCHIVGLLLNVCPIKLAVHSVKFYESDGNSVLLFSLIWLALKILRIFCVCSVSFWLVLGFFSRFALLQHHFYLTVFYSLGVYSFEWSCVFQTYKQERTTFWVAFHNRTSPLGIVFIMIQRDLNSSHFFNKQKEKKSRNIYCITFKRTSSLIQLMNVGNCSVSCFRVDFYFQ